MKVGLQWHQQLRRMLLWLSYFTYNMMENKLCQFCLIYCDSPLEIPYRLFYFSEATCVILGLCSNIGEDRAIWIYIEGTRHITWKEEEKANSNGNSYCVSTGFVYRFEIFYVAIYNNSFDREYFTCQVDLCSGLSRSHHCTLPK